ncbi:MAG: LamG domain-containing protein [Planctomycetaceae bacterium]
MHQLRIFLVLILCSSATLFAADDEVLRAPLEQSIQLSGEDGLKASAKNLVFTQQDGNSAAQFDGRSSELIIEKSPLAKIGAHEFSLSAWVNIADETDDVIGDLFSQYDPATRRGFNLSIKTNSGVTSSQSNFRQLQFGIDNGQLESEWTDHGQVGDAVFIYSMATVNGQLYAGTCESGVEGAGHLYRWEAGQNWYDCGAPDKSNAVSAIAEFDGELYVATSKYRLKGSALDESPNENWGGKIYRYNPESGWTHCGTLPEIDAINGLVVYRGSLYASATYKPGGLFRYEGGNTWEPCGLPEGKRVESLTVYNGNLFATGYDQAGIYKYDGENWSQVGLLPEATQTYGFAVYQGELYVSEWPNARIYKYIEDNNWLNVGRLGEELESMPLLVYNGKMYCGSLPLAAVYRYDEGETWTDLGRVDLTPDVKYRRAWSMSIHQGRLFVGTIPSGRVWSIAAGANATHDRTFPQGWHHVTAVRESSQLKLYLDGELVAESPRFNSTDYDLSSSTPLRIGNGQHDHFRGHLKEARVYKRALTPAEIQKLARP